jgi:Queuosine biosynthesis protein QueC
MSLPFTIDDHFVFGYNNIPFSRKENVDHDEFFCTYSRCSRIPDSFKTECINTAKIISEQSKLLGRIPYIFLSGGLDSEVVVRSFIDAGIKFKAVSFRYTDNLSSHETIFIDKFVKKHEIDHSYYDIDSDWLISLESKQFAKDSQCSMSEMLPHMKLIKHVWDNLNGFPILGNGDLYVSKDISVDWIFDRSKPKYNWNYIEYEYILAWNRFAIYHNILGALNFFMHNPEIVLSMIKDQDMFRCLSGEIKNKLSSRSTKSIVYIKSWKDLEPRLKYHGSEQIGGRCVDLNREYISKYKTVKKYAIPIKEFIDMLEPK